MSERPLVSMPVRSWGCPLRRKRGPIVVGVSVDVYLTWECRAAVGLPKVSEQAYSGDTGYLGQDYGLGSSLTSVEGGVAISANMGRGYAARVLVEEAFLDWDDPKYDRLEGEWYERILERCCHCQKLEVIPEDDACGEDGWDFPEWWKVYVPPATMRARLLEAEGIPLRDYGPERGRALYKAMVDVDCRLADIEFWKMPYADTAAL